MQRSHWIGIALLGVLATTTALASDWPQWRGPDRTGLSKETGLLKSWPAGGPRLVWKGTNLGEGHATPSVAGGRIFGMGLRGDEEVVWALSEQTGKELWHTRIAGGVQLDAGQGGYGSRSTPTVVGDKLYTLGVSGEAACLSVADGKLLWHHNLVSEFGGSIPRWGYSESPLVDGNTVVVAPGGNKATIIGLNKTTGATLWQTAVPGGDAAHYSSAIAASVGGQKEYIHFLSSGVIGLSASDGKFLWRYNQPANGTANCATPIFHDQHVFAASGYGQGAGLAHLEATANGVTPKEVYATKQMRNHHGGVILVGEYLYGCDDRTLTCMELKTGKVLWANQSVGKGSLTYADGHLYLRSEKGPVGLIEATPSGYVEKGRFEQPERSGAASWPYPVIANGHLYLRDQGILLCYDVRGTAADK